MTEDRQVAVVTGAASGMGAATVEALLDRDYRVIGFDRDEQGLTRFAGSPHVTTRVTDVTDAGDVTAAVDEVVDRWGRIDVVVNAAGVMVRATTEDTTDSDWRHIFSVNVDGVFHLCRAAIPHMRTQRSGAIVNFGSMWGNVGAAGHAAYAATKGAVHQLTRSLALEHATHGIRVNAVCPGEIRTPMLEGGRSGPSLEKELQELADRVVPMRRLGDPAEVARVVAFLASSEASYMTGALVPVDAGCSAG